MPLTLGDYSTIAAAVEEEMSSDGLELTSNTAWNFLYRYCLSLGDGDLPHIVEANLLKEKAWQIRAKRVADWLAQNIAPGRTLASDDLKVRLDRAWTIAHEKYDYTGNRSNLVGDAFEFAVSHVIRRLCVDVEPIVGSSIREFRGFELARRSEVDELDIALFTRQDFRMFLSLFWTTRKDRLASDLYEAAFIRQRRPDVTIAFIVNEFHRSHIDHLWVSGQVDRIYHVARAPFLNAQRPTKRDGSFYESPFESEKAARELTVYLELRNRVTDISELFGDIARIRP